MTDSPYTDKRKASEALAPQLPSVTITEMYYDYRVTDGWKSVKPSNAEGFGFTDNTAFVYPKARTLIKEYQREYKEKWAEG